MKRRRSQKSRKTRGTRSVKTRTRRVASRRTTRRSYPVRRFSYTNNPAPNRGFGYASKPARRVRRRSGIRRANRQSRAASLIAAGVASAGVGAVMGALANEAGLLMKAPTQNKLGISASGLVGFGLIVVGLFVKSEGLKLLFYGLGGGLLVEELTRQIDMRFYDFRVAFAGAPALDYSQGISGAQAQLAGIEVQRQAAAQLPPASVSETTQRTTPATPPRASRPSQGAQNSREDSSPSRGTQAPSAARGGSSPAQQPSVQEQLFPIPPATRRVLDTIQPGDFAFLEFDFFNAPQSATFLQSVRTTLEQKGVISERQPLELSAGTIALFDKIGMSDLPVIRESMESGAPFSSAVFRGLQMKGVFAKDSAGHDPHEAYRYKIRRVAAA